MGEPERVRQYVYRSVATLLEPGRWARNVWVMEPWLMRESGTRSIEGKLKPKPKGKMKVKGGPSQAGPVAMHKPEDMPARKNLYEMVGVQDVQVNGRFRVLAKCTGGYCRGKTRVFPATEWASERKSQTATACHACATAMRRLAKRVAKAALLDAAEQVAGEIAAGRVS